MGKRADKKEETEAAILAASLRLFLEKGFKGTTMREVASEAGIALGTTYNYFPTKEHIALFFFERSLDGLMARYHDAVAPDMALEEQLFMLNALGLEQVAPYEEFLNVIVVQAAAPGSRLNPLGEDAERLKARYLAFVAGLLREARARGELPVVGVPDGILLDAYWIYHLGVLLFWLNDDSPGKEDTYVLIDKSIRFMLNALRGGATSSP